MGQITKRDLIARNIELERENNLNRELLMAKVRQDKPDYQTTVKLICYCRSDCDCAPLFFTIELFRSTRAYCGIVLETSVYKSGDVPNVNVVYADDWLAHYKNLINRLGGQWHAFAKSVSELEAARNKALDLHRRITSMERSKYET